MSKKKIIEKIKKIANENPKKITTVILIILLVSLGGLTLYLFFKTVIIEKQKPIIATDDMMIVSYNFSEVEGNFMSYRIDNSEILRHGYYISNGNWSTREFYRIWIQFKLPEVLKNWTKCFLRVNAFNFRDGTKKGKYGLRIFVNSSWNETMNYDELTWKSEGKFVKWDFMDTDNVRSTGIITYDMSNYIENSNSITVKFYTRNAALEHEDYFESRYFDIYSKDSNVNKEYLPQLIWS